MATALSRRDPTAIGRYDLVERIGKGGMGSVYRGRDRESGDIVAIKVLAADLGTNAKLYERFTREFQAASKLDHPNIVRALDLGLDGRKAYLVMEFVDGRSLGQIIEEDGPVPEGLAVRVVTQIAQALHYAHRRRVIHRDVKPDNVIIRPDGMAKLADFGLAKDFDDDRELTKPATGLGTPHFMAPEQYTDAKNVGALSDVYALGATLYCALTGRVPFEDCATLVALTRKIKGDLPSARDLMPGITPQVDEAIRRAMAADPSGRPLSALKFVKLLPSRRQIARVSGVPSRSALTRSRPKPDQDGAERRATVRHGCAVTTTCVIDTSAIEAGAEEDWPATMQDVSTGGVGLVLARRFEPGTLFDVRVEGGTAKEPARTFRVRVARVLPEAMGHWLHGCAFDAPLADLDLNRLLG